MQIGKKIRKLIKANGIKQVHICRAVKLSPSRLSNYLSGTREPDLETLGKICDFLGVTIDSLRESHTEEHPADAALTALNNSLEPPVLVIHDSISDRFHRVTLSIDTARQFLEQLASNKEDIPCPQN